jgi:hypothetical protein
MLIFGAAIGSFWAADYHILLVRGSAGGDSNGVQVSKTWLIGG